MRSWQCIWTMPKGRHGGEISCICRIGLIVWMRSSSSTKKIFYMTKAKWPLPSQRRLQKVNLKNSVFCRTGHIKVISTVLWQISKKTANKQNKSGNPTLPILLSEVWGFCIRFTDHIPIRAERFLPHSCGCYSCGAPILFDQPLWALQLRLPALP